MANIFKSSKTAGVRYKEHETRKHGRQKDKFYAIRYQKDKKQIQEYLGWASQGWTDEKAGKILTQIKENIKMGVHPQSLAEIRAMNEEDSKKKEEKKAETLSEIITLREVFDKYIEVHKNETSEKTWMRTKSCYLVWIDKSLGNSKIIDITPDDIQPVIIKVLSERAPRTADYVKTVLRQIFNFAKKRDLYFKDNPAMKIKIKLKDNKRSRFLTLDEMGILLEELKKHSINVHDMALLSLYEGARAGAILALQWKDVNWDTNRISLLDTKNGESYYQPIHPITKKMLLRRYEEDKTGYIFKARDGGKMKEIPDTYQRVVDKLGFNDGITDARQKVVFHTLRHTYASQLVMKGVDLYTTQKLMGHKSAQMTQRYAHLAPGHLEKAINLLEGV